MSGDVLEKSATWLDMPRPWVVKNNSSNSWIVGADGHARLVGVEGDAFMNDVKDNCGFSEREKYLSIPKNINDPDAFAFTKLPLAEKIAYHQKIVDYVNNHYPMDAKHVAGEAVV